MDPSGLAFRKPKDRLCRGPASAGCHRQGAFIVNNNESTMPHVPGGPAAMRERGVLQIGIASVARMARDMSLSRKRPALRAPGAIPTLDFLLHHLGAVVKKTGVKSKDWT